MRKIIYFLFILTTLTACWNNHDCHHSLQIKNNSMDTVFYTMKAYEGNAGMEFCYLAGEKLAPSESRIEKLSTCWEEVLSGTSTFDFYIVSKDCINDYEFYDCDSIEQKNQILKAYSLTLEEIQDMNWAITYP